MSAAEPSTVEIPIWPETELAFEAMGTRVRILVGAPMRRGLAPAGEAAAAVRAWIETFDERLSRFRPESELSRLNADPRFEVKVSALLAELVAAAVRAAGLTDGLSDPTMAAQIRAAGYEGSRTRAPAGLLDEALRWAPARQPARPEPGAGWRSIRVDRDACLIRRPPGVELDSGGVGKGLAADLACRRLAGYQRVLVDCGGDIRVAGAGAMLDPYEVLIAHPLDGSRRRRVRLGRGAIATSGIDGRIWRLADGFGHHLLDPATGLPAWTGVISATAIARDAVAAEALAKAALLAGPEGARRVLSAHGGSFVSDDGGAETVSPEGGRA